MESNDEIIIVRHFEQLWESLCELCLHIHDQLVDYPLWIEEEGAFIHNRDKVIYSLKLLTQRINIGAQETWNCPGVVACTQETGLLIQNINQLKVQFKKLVRDYKQHHHIKNTKVIRDILASKGHSGLKLKQIYRQIRYIPYQPARIAWSKGKAYAHTVLTKEKARQALLRTGEGANIEIQLSKLDLLKPDEKLVKRIPIKPQWFANITYHSQGNTYYQQIVTSLPIFYLTQDLHRKPTVCFAKANNRRAKIVRADQKIEDKPFLASIHAYRYKKGQHPMNDKTPSILSFWGFCPNPSKIPRAPYECPLALTS